MGKTALITGASRGIGAATARILAREGWRVAVNYCRSKTEAEALAASLPETAALPGDVSDAAQAEELVRRTEALLGPVELLVNNAGIALQKLFTDTTEEEWDRLFAVDVKGIFLMSRAVLPGMIRRHSGSIVNVSSIWGLTGASCEACYSAAKAAVIGFTKALAKELGPSGIRVNCVAPGVIATEMNQGLDAGTLAALREETPLGAIGTAREVAEVILWLAGEGASFVTGQVIGVNGGFVI